MSEQEHEDRLRKISEFLWKVDEHLCHLHRDIMVVQDGIKAALPDDHDYCPGLTRLAS